MRMNDVTCLTRPPPLLFLLHLLLLLQAYYGEHVVQLDPDYLTVQGSYSPMGIVNGLVSDERSGNVQNEFIQLAWMDDG